MADINTFWIMLAIQEEYERDMFTTTGKIVKAIIENNGRIDNVNSIRKKCGLVYSNVYKAINKLEKSGIVCVRRRKGTGSVITFTDMIVDLGNKKFNDIQSELYG